MKSDLLKDTFQNVVNIYDKARPGYPMELLEDVQRFANVKSFKKGLEVGAGTGQATDLFLDKIEKLDIIEVGEKQVDFLNNKYGDKNVYIHQSYFEDFLAAEKYDLIYSATAFHWVDAGVGYPKAWDMLTSEGVMAVFWHMSSVTYHGDRIFAGLNEIR